MKCRAVEKNLAAYVFGELSAADRERVETHIATCEACAREVRDMQATTELLAAAFAGDAQPALSADKRLELFGKAAAEKASAAAARRPAAKSARRAPVRFSASRLFRRLPAVAAAACMVVGFAGLLLSMMQHTFTAGGPSLGVDSLGGTRSKSVRGRGGNYYYSMEREPLSVGERFESAPPAGTPAAPVSSSGAYAVATEPGYTTWGGTVLAQSATEAKYAVDPLSGTADYFGNDVGTSGGLGAAPAAGRYGGGMGGGMGMGMMGGAMESETGAGMGSGMGGMGGMGAAPGGMPGMGMGMMGDTGSPMGPGAGGEPGGMAEGEGGMPGMGTGTRGKREENSPNSLDLPRDLMDALPTSGLMMSTRSSSSPARRPAVPKKPSGQSAAHAGEAGDLDEFTDLSVVSDLKGLASAGEPAGEDNRRREVRQRTPSAPAPTPPPPAEPALAVTLGDKPLRISSLYGSKSSKSGADIRGRAAPAEADGRRDSRSNWFDADGDSALTFRPRPTGETRGLGEESRRSGTDGFVPVPKPAPPPPLAFGVGFDSGVEDGEMQLGQVVPGSSAIAVTRNPVAKKENLPREGKPAVSAPVQDRAEKLAEVHWKWSEPVVPRVAGAPDARPEIMKQKLDAIVLPSLELQDTPVDEAARVLRLKTQELDPDGEGLNIVVLDQNGAVDPGAVTMDMEDVSAGLALGALAAGSGKDIVVDDYGVVLARDGDAVRRAGDVLRKETAKDPALNRIIIPHVEFDATPLRDVVEVLGRRSRELDPEGRGIEIVPPSNADDAWEVPVTLSMNNVPVGEVLRYTALATGATIRVEGDRVEVVPQETEPEDTPPLPEPGKVTVNPFVMAAKDRFSTFALDTDTASYSMARNEILGNGYLPPAHTVRVEEFVNSFDYNYTRRGTRTFSIHAEGAPSPFRPSLTLLKVGVRGKVIGRDGMRPSHLVFVVDASGSMGKADRMPLVRLSLEVLTGQLQPGDAVSVVTYGSTPALVAEAVPVSERDRILQAVGTIQCTGSTNLTDGLELGYRVAAKHFLPNGNNRVILCSDGVANVGQIEAADVLRRIDAYRAQGISLTAAGFGAGAYNDSLLETLANKGDGNYVFIDSEAEARRVFETAVAGTLQMIAKDAKIQVEFNPARVRRYRLLGYENRDIADKDFRNDAVDAGEVGSGQSATALYELELLGDPRDPDLPDPGTVYVRYRDIDTGKVEEISTRILNTDIRPRTPETDPRFFLGACAAEFAEVLRGSPYVADTAPGTVARLAQEVAAALPVDPTVQEFLQIVTGAEGLPRRR